MPETHVVISAPSGRVRGRRCGSVLAFKGIPYAVPPIGTRRLRPPQPIEPWSGVRDALDFGPAAIQELSLGRNYPFGPIDAMSEDCLTLNVWAPVGAARLPVIVWIHGGGFRMGASSMPAYDGTNYAATGRVVMVSLNYRLGVLGFGAHQDLGDGEGGAFANWAIQDQMLALRWIKENIAAFGGDPERLTVMGESGGAINAIMIAHSVQGRGLIQQIIAMSPPYICPPATLAIDDWHPTLEAVAGDLGSTIRGLRELPASAVHESEWRHFVRGGARTASGRAYRGAVADGVVLSEWPAFQDLPPVPMILGCTNAEGAMGYECYHPLSGERISRFGPTDDDSLRREAHALLHRLYDVQDTGQADEVIEYYAACARAAGRRTDLTALMVELHGDSMIRHYCVRKAEAAARSGRSNVFFYSYGLPVAQPNRDPPHAWELPVAFGNHHHRLLAPWVGSGPLHDAVARIMIESFTTFAENGRPAAAGMPQWPAFRNGEADVMLLGYDDAAAALGPLPKCRQLRALDQVAVLTR